MKLYMFQTVRLSIIRILFTVHSAMVYTIAECTVNKILMMDRRTVRKM